MRYRAVVAYDGTDFRGFAAQSGDVRTVAGELNGVLSRLTRSEVAVSCAGRTDAGVHAWGQVIAFDFGERADVDPEGVCRAVNGQCGPEIVMRSCEPCGDDFDPRRDAIARTYRYTVVNHPVPDPFAARYSWWVPEPLDVAGMRLGADALVGEHDFASFCRQGPAGSTTRRRVLATSWQPEGDHVIAFDITGTAFCWQMVRSIVGTLVDVGRRRRRAGDVVAILRARRRDAAGPVAPPHGLCLREVRY